MPYLPDAERDAVGLMPLFRDAREEVRLERWAPGAAITFEVPGGVEILAIDGAFVERGEEFEALSWLRLPAGDMLRATAGRRGCQVWVKTGHLLHIAVPPDAP
jgi:hypothetical protein